MTSKPNEQDQINDEILSSLHDILGQNRQIIAKIDEQNHRIDNLESTLTKKATMAGAVAGTVSGSIASGVLMVGLELLKAKFGG